MIMIHLFYSEFAKLCDFAALREKNISPSREYAKKLKLNSAT